MRRVFQTGWLRLLVTWLLLAGVVFVFVSPAVDLEQSALRANRLASVFFWMLAAAAFFIAVQGSLCSGPDRQLDRVAHSFVKTLPLSDDVVSHMTALRI